MPQGATTSSAGGGKRAGTWSPALRSILDPSVDRVQFNGSVFTNNFCDATCVPKNSPLVPPAKSIRLSVFLQLCIWIVFVFIYSPSPSPSPYHGFCFGFLPFLLASFVLFGQKTSSACANFGLNGNELERRCVEVGVGALRF